MKLTERQAVELSIELWEWLAETGEEKRDWPEWERNGGQYERMDFDCFLCELFNKDTDSCPECPYFVKHGKCTEEGTPFGSWHSAEANKDKKKYARRFLNQLKEILEDMEEPVKEPTGWGYITVSWSTPLVNETLTIENVEIDLETLDDAAKQRGSLARWAIVEAVIDALDSEDRAKLEAYRNQ